MDDTEAVHGSTYDAEAVLLALGSRLEWSDFILSSQRIGWWGQHDGTTYVIKIKKGKFFCTRLTSASRTENNLPVFKTVPAAKAACERHYATGKWE